jgi:hypothetical protein
LDIFSSEVLDINAFGSAQIPATASSSTASDSSDPFLTMTSLNASKPSSTETTTLGDVSVLLLRCDEQSASDISCEPDKDVVKSAEDCCDESRRGLEEIKRLAAENALLRSELEQLKREKTPLSAAEVSSLTNYDNFWAVESNIGDGLARGALPRSDDGLSFPGGDDSEQSRSDH